MFIPSQYKDSITFINFLEALRSEAYIISAEVTNVIDLRWLTKAQGKNLDIIGEIVGVNREVVDFIEAIYFGFEPDPTALTFTDLNDLSLGGRYRDALENPVQTRLLSDAEFRLLITAKILKNKSNITPNECLEITRQIMIMMFGDFIGGDIGLNISEDGNASFTIFIAYTLSGNEQAFLLALDLIPRPVGVKIAYDFTVNPFALLNENGLIMFTESGEILEIQ